MPGPRVPWAASEDGAVPLGLESSSGLGPSRASQGTHSKGDKEATDDTGRGILSIYPNHF